ncbi:hypothetical protein LE181_31480 [Streptomyces sp. SCA3-4]|uniref:hypothetical protein n=1 Tax=Streptomyces sichuanensis TaxID=2871810 RepID=UPI001CE30B9F|nr:hypothetical protein [Streptomyces sichuanensis]MCA6096666.1 hypothetical protein [Streptomyces sichuanensis]
MTAVPVEITTGPPTLTLAPAPAQQPAPEPAGIVAVADIETLAAGSTPGCNDDNPYQ